MRSLQTLIENLALHSNLVLFKWVNAFYIIQFKYLYIPIWFYSNGDQALLCMMRESFTFQSGSIQIEMNANTEKKSNIFFTFQSGSIQMEQ